jgi:hypothetical protein
MSFKTKGKLSRILISTFPKSVLKKSLKEKNLEAYNLPNESKPIQRKSFIRFNAISDPEKRISGNEALTTNGKLPWNLYQEFINSYASLKKNPSSKDFHSFVKKLLGMIEGAKVVTKLKIGTDQIIDDQSEVDKILAEIYTQKLGANSKTKIKFLA